MPTAQITDGTTTVDFVHLRRDSPVPAQQFIREIPKSGVNGHTYQKLGKKSEPFVMLSLRDFDTTAAARTAEDDYSALQGKVVTLYDDHGEQYDDVFVIRVRPGPTLRAKNIAGGLAGSPQYVKRAQWTLQRVGDALGGS